jgi:hypothetical protein
LSRGMHGFPRPTLLNDDGSWDIVDDLNRVQL